MSDESSDSDPRFWVNLLEQMNTGKGKGEKGKGKYTTPFNIFQPKAFFPKLPSPAGPPWPGGKG
eukprot:4099453-Lingulodinium_polyedra.AAC.1